MRKVILLCLSILVIFGLSACGAKNSAEKDLSSTLDAICTDPSKDAYIYGEVLAGGDVLASVSEAEPDDINRLIRSQIKYEIEETSVGEDTAAVRMTVTAPDMLQMIETVASPAEGEDMDALLARVSDDLEGGDFPEKEFDVTVTLRQMDEHWYLVLNSDLGNALTGGLLERYSQIIQEAMEHWGEQE